MARIKLLWCAIAVIAVCSVAGTSFAAPKKCDFNGDYSFFFWDMAFGIRGVGYFGVDCAGKVLPGGILNCNFGFGDEFEDFIEGGSVFLESDGEGTMEIETESTFGICGTRMHSLELDISVVQGGKTVLFNNDTEQYSSSGLIPQAGYEFNFTGRGDKCFGGALNRGCYDIRFWNSIYVAGPPVTEVGDCTICIDGLGDVTGGNCRCSIQEILGPRLETQSGIVTGAYTLGENCQSSTGYLWFVTDSDDICNIDSALALDFTVALGGKELLGACDVAPFILSDLALENAGFELNCSFEGWLH